MNLCTFRSRFAYAPFFFHLLSSLVFGSSLVSWLILLSLLPTAMAVPSTSPFPKISFQVFSTFVTNNFGTNITLATALVLFFSITDNPDLINLHARQQNPQVPDEYEINLSGWIRQLSKSLLERLEPQKSTLFRPEENVSTEALQVTTLATKLDELAKLLPYPRSLHSPT